MSALSDRVSQPDLANLPDWQVSQILNAPDPTLPEVVQIITRLIGVGQILTVLGPDAGAAFLDSLASASAQRPVIKYVIGLLERGEMDAGSAIVRSEVMSLESQGLLTAEQAASLLALGENRYFPSWAQYNNVTVDARSVGIARGAKP